jgi:nucleoside 2-deoxyribosyltransferase
MERLRCFVAMAISRPDTDRVYDHFIAPTLRRRGVNPIFMGRLEHNDDVDDRIILELSKCDLALADLTYARPSVYFEAGYAEHRKVPVIYTCRRDHFHPREHDQHGNFRVHFDLQMKNIIGWSSPKDRGFAKRLERRINLVTRPLLRVKETEAQQSREERNFKELPLATRLQSVHRIFRSVLRRIGYRPIVENEERSPWVGFKIEKRALDLTVLWVQPRFTQNEIRAHDAYVHRLVRSRFQEVDKEDYLWQFQWPGFRKPKAVESKRVKTVVARLLFCSLDRIPAQRVATALPSYGANQDLNVYVSGGLELVGAGTPLSAARTLPLSVAVHIVDDISTERVARAKSSKLFYAASSLA